VRVGLVSNPTAGGGRHAGHGERAEECLRHRGLDVIVRATKAPGDATRAAAELAPQVEAVVAVGGDGTVNEVVNGLAGTGIPLGIVPAGTVNVLALELCLPFDLAQACDVVAAGRTRLLDLGTVDGRGFLLMTGAGLDALTIRRLDPRAKRRFREAAFVWEGLRTFLEEDQPEFPLAVDGHELSARFAVVGNCRYYGGRFGVTTRADPADGLLDVLVFRGKGLLTNLSFWLGVPWGGHLRHPQVTYLRGQRVELGPPDQGEVWFQTDGELAGRLPAVVTVRPAALKVFVPSPPGG
jgi:YegS/Rv2252/BmrU family lipid kinase